jgi:hypothetical protein
MSASEIIMVAGMLFFAMFMMKSLFETRRFLKYLEENYPAEFTKLGFPNWKIQWGDRSLRIATKYIRQRQFEQLKDENLELSYKLIKNYERFAWVCGAVALIAPLAGLYLGF